MPAALTATGATSAEEQGFAVDEASMYWVDARATAVPGVYRAAKAGGAAAHDRRRGGGIVRVLHRRRRRGGVRGGDGGRRDQDGQGGWRVDDAVRERGRRPRELAVDGGELFVLENDDAGCGGPRQAIVALPAAGGAARLVAAAASMGRLRLDGDDAHSSTR